MSTPFYASKLGAIVIPTVALWGLALGLAVAVDGPHKAEAQAKRQLARLEAAMHAGQHHAIHVPRHIENA